MSSLYTLPMGHSDVRAFLLEAHAAMARIRAFEELVAEAHSNGRLPGLLHLSIGGEAVAHGVVGGLRRNDRVYSSHRAHGHFLAAGTDARRILAELAGRDSGLCRGRGGSMHLMGDQAVMATGVVGGTLPIAVGHALALSGDAVAVVFFGDGAVQTGLFHESLNLAALWTAPVLFVCENNGWAEFSAREEHTRVADVAAYGELHRLPTAAVDGSDVLAVRETSQRLLTSVRAGAGPALLECHVVRIRPHYEGDLRRGDDPSGDPLARLEDRLVAEGTEPGDLVRERVAARAELDDALALALGDPLPDAANDADLVFASRPG